MAYFNGRTTLYCFTLASYCSKCGNIRTGRCSIRSSESFKTFETDEVLEVYKKDEMSDNKCHYCGSILFKKENTVWEESAYGVEEAARLKKVLQEKVSQQNEEEGRKKVEEIAEKIKPLDDMPLDNQMAQKIKENPSTLIPYIKQVIDLEVWACFLREHLTKLEVEEFLAKQRKVEEKHWVKDRNKWTEEKLLKQIETLQKEFKKTNWAKDLEKKEICPPSEPIYLEEIIPKRPTEPVYKKPSFFNKSKVLEENNRLKKEYEDALLVCQQQLKQYEENKSINDKLSLEYEQKLEEYENQVKEEEKRIKKEKAKIKAEAKKQLNESIDKINKQIEELKQGKTEWFFNRIDGVIKKAKKEQVDLLKSLYNEINKLFSINVIYSNYRDVFAMTAFFEYFNSQRVYDLVGPDGAYNLYEKERRSDATSTLIKTLEDIGKNQVVLYKELSKILSKEQKLEKTLKETIEKAFANGSKTENLDELAEEVFKDYFDKSQEFSDQIKHSISDAEAYLKSLE